MKFLILLIFCFSQIVTFGQQSDSVAVDKYEIKQLLEQLSKQQINQKNQTIKQEENQKPIPAHDEEISKKVALYKKMIEEIQIEKENCLNNPKKCCKIEELDEKIERLKLLIAKLSEP